jgi:hypothetical protein
VTHVLAWAPLKEASSGHGTDVVTPKVIEQPGMKLRDILGQTEFAPSSPSIVRSQPAAQCRRFICRGSAEHVHLDLGLLSGCDGASEQPWRSRRSPSAPRPERVVPAA